MGLNFYFHAANTEERKHIGKSSAGWVFALHVYPEDGINDLQDWMRYLDSQEGMVKDEYQRKVTVPELLDWIANRGREDSVWENAPYGYASWEQFHKQNHSERGPRGLLRHDAKYDYPWFVKHGHGTWDCLTGEFS